MALVSSSSASASALASVTRIRRCRKARSRSQAKRREKGGGGCGLLAADDEDEEEEEEEGAAAAAEASAARGGSSSVAERDGAAAPAPSAGGTVRTKTGLMGDGSESRPCTRQIVGGERCKEVHDVQGCVGSDREGSVRLRETSDPGRSYTGGDLRGGHSTAQRVTICAARDTRGTVVPEGGVDSAEAGLTRRRGTAVRSFLVFFIQSNVGYRGGGSGRGRGGGGGGERRWSRKRKGG